MRLAGGHPKNFIADRVLKSLPNGRGPREAALPAYQENLGYLDARVHFPYRPCLYKYTTDSGCAERSPRREHHAEALSMVLIGNIQRSTVTSPSFCSSTRSLKTVNSPTCMNTGHGSQHGTWFVSKLYLSLPCHCSGSSKFLIGSNGTLKHPMLLICGRLLLPGALTFNLV